MDDVSVLTRLGNFASEKARYYGRVTFELTKSSFSFCIDKVERKKMLEYTCRVASCCQAVMMDVQSSTRLYLRPDHLDMILQRICGQILQQSRTEDNYLLFEHRKSYKSLQFADHCSITNQNEFYRHACFKDLMAAIIWHEFNPKLDVDYLPKFDGKLKNWNKRVNEKELLQKLGSPTRWDIFFDDPDENDNADIHGDDIKENGTDLTNLIEKDTDNVNIAACIDHLQKVDNLKKSIMGAGDTYLTNDLRQPLVFNTGCNKQKKRNSVLSSIRKIFKTEKTPATPKLTPVHQEHVESNNLNQNSMALKNMKNLNTIKSESEMSKCKRGDDILEAVCNTDKQTNAAGPGIEDIDKNSLMIHIPNNVQKIVLVKDGHKIKLEI